MEVDDIPISTSIVHPIIPKAESESLYPVVYSPSVNGNLLFNVSIYIILLFIFINTLLLL
jgi:hypothetical protein